MKYRILSLCATIALSGCATANRFNVSIDAMADIAYVKRGSFMLRPADPAVSPGSLEYQEVARYVSGAMIEKGYTRADAQEADILVLVEYGISEPNIETVWSSKRVRNYEAEKARQESGNSSAVAIYKTESYAESTKTFDRFLSLSAYDVADDAEAASRNSRSILEMQRELWSVSVKSTGSSGDLRRVIPMLVAAAEEYVGQQTNQVVTQAIREDDPRVIRIKSANAVQ